MNGTVIYKLGDTNIRTTVNVTKEGQRLAACTEYSADDYLEYLNSSGEGEFVEITWEEAIQHLERAQDKQYTKPFREISKEDYEEALNCLPPEKWERDEFEIFRMSEKLISNITAHYVLYKNKCFVANRRTSTPYSEIKKEIAEIVK